MAYVTVSTGIGAGVLLGRRLVRGRRSLAELGHTVLDLGALAAGLPATVEALGSGTALEREAARASPPADGVAVERLVREAHVIANRIWGEVTRAAALGIVNLAFLFSPEVVVVGGGVGQSGDLLLEPVREQLRRHGPPGLADHIEVRGAELGDDAGLVGAAAWDRATAPGGPEGASG